MAKLLTGTRIYGTGTVDTQLSVNGTAQVTSTNSGALRVVGGIGIGGGGVFGGTVTATNFVGAFSGSITGAATQVNTVQQSNSAVYYPTFVDSNNVSAGGESVYTSANFFVNPNSGALYAGFTPNRVDSRINIDKEIYYSMQRNIEEGSGTGMVLIGGTNPTAAINTSTSAPFGRVLSHAVYSEHITEEYIPVYPGETLYGEIWAFRANGATGTAGLLYAGVAQFDSNKLPVAANNGLSYFVAGGVTVPTTGVWTKYSGTVALATSHTPFTGSDGGPVRYVRPYLIVNYTGGTIPTQLVGLVIRRTNIYRDSGNVVFNGGGRVGVGIATPVAKLQSTGASQENSPTLGSATGAGLYVTNTDPAYGLLAGVGGGGNAWLQVQRTDSSATAYNLHLQPSGGNVGIGTSSPVDKLQVTGGGVTAQSIQAIGTPSTYAPGGGISINYASGVGSIRAYNNTSGTGTAVINFITAGTEGMRFDAAGNLGIGTAAPTSKLHVAGNALITGITTVTNTLVHNGGYAYLGNYNSGTPIYPSSPTPGGLGLAFALNFSAGNVEQNIWNTAQPSTYSGTGIRFMQYLTTSTYKDTLFISNTGAIAFNGASNYGSSGQLLQSNGNASPTWVNASGLTAGIASQVNTVQQTANATYYPTFVDANNASAAAESLFTTSTFSINPSTGFVNHSTGGIVVGDTANTISLQSDYSSPLIIQRSSNSNKGALLLRGSDTIGTAIEFGRSNAASHWGTYFSFYVHDDNTSDPLLSIKEKMRINATGVGIGTTTTNAKFVVNGGTVNNTTYTSSEARISDGTIHLMKTAAGGVFEAVRAMNLDTTVGTTVRVLGAATSDPFNNGNGGKVFIDAIRTATNMDLAFLLNDVAGAAAVERVRFMGNGNVGLGTSTPNAKLETYSASTGGANIRLTKANSGSADQGSQELQFVNFGPANTARGPGVSLGKIYFGASQPTSGNIQDAGQISVLADGTQAGTVTPSAMVFYTAATNTNIERMRISSTGVVTISSGIASTNTATGALVIQGGVGINGALNAISKSFNIGHPTKPGMSLRYGSLEGPEFGVYVRGRLKGSNTIELPEYWTKLVDPDTITVNLTPVGSHQKLYVEDIVNNTVVVGNENIFGKAVDCFYTVWAERADIDKLQVESE